MSAEPETGAGMSAGSVISAARTDANEEMCAGVRDVKWQECRELQDVCGHAFCNGRDVVAAKSMNERDCQREVVGERWF